MYMSRFGVKRYKCLGEIDIPLTPIHVLIGENDAGKTSLLEAKAAFLGSGRNPIASQFSEPWEGRELVLHGAGKPTIELSGEWSETKAGDSASLPLPPPYGFEVEFPAEGKDCRMVGEWIANGQSMRDVPHPSRDHTGIAWWVHYGNVPDNWNTEYSLLSNALTPAHKYRLDPEIMAIPAAINPQRKFRMDPDGFGLATLLDDILGHDAQSYLQLRNAFVGYFPQFASVRISTERAMHRDHNPAGLHGSREAVGKGIWFETRGQKTVRAQQASDGAILFLGLLALAYVPEPPRVLLLEEPENAVYPKRLSEVIRLLKSMSSRESGRELPQIILTTHSPYVLDSFEPEEVTFLSRPPGDPDGPVRARPLRDAPSIRERLGSEFYLGELWYNLSEQDLFGDG